MEAAGLRGKQNWALILSSSARVSKVTYETVIAVRYPELDADTPTQGEQRKCLLKLLIRSQSKTLPSTLCSIVRNVLDRSKQRYISFEGSTCMLSMSPTSPNLPSELADRQTRVGGFMPVFWWSPHDVIHATVDLGQMVEWISQQLELEAGEWLFGCPPQQQ